MPSEELQHRYPLNIGKKIGDFELFQTQLTTLNQFSEHGILSKRILENGAPKNVMQ